MRWRHKIKPLTAISQIEVVTHYFVGRPGRGRRWDDKLELRRNGCSDSRSTAEPAPTTPGCATTYARSWLRPRPMCDRSGMLQWRPSCVGHIIGNGQGGQDRLLGALERAAIFVRDALVTARRRGEGHMDCRPEYCGSFR